MCWKRAHNDRTTIHLFSVFRTNGWLRWLCVWRMGAYDWCGYGLDRSDNRQWQETKSAIGRGGAKPLVSVTNPDPTQARRTLLAFLPFVIFITLTGLFMWAMFGNRVDKHASPLIGKPVPLFTLPALDGSTFDLSTYIGRPIILNVYASWCAPCRVEHPQLLQLSKDSRFLVLGIAYKDDPARTASYIAELGNPYIQTALDRQGSVGVQLGLAGVPETYVISAEGIVLTRHQGEVTAKVAGELAALAAGSAPNPVR
jgi:cytochrome c biogenesis protein CcmG, thiol:disulfide interchange protein DsbE